MVCQVILKAIIDRDIRLGDLILTNLLKWTVEQIEKETMGENWSIITSAIRYFNYSYQRLDDYITFPIKNIKDQKGDDTVI